jgi:plasmid stabilization system protein ParE
VSFRVRYTRGARDDLKRLYAFLLEYDTAAAARALEAIRRGTELLANFPFTCRKVDEANPFLREMLISFDGSGYVALFEIEGAQRDVGPAPSGGEGNHSVTILAVRHQREDDYH